MAVVVVLVWAVGYMYAVFDPRFQPSPLLSTVMLAIVGWLFAMDRRKGNGNGGPSR